MLKKLWCYLWGHVSVVKAYTGSTVVITDRLSGNAIVVPTYKWEKQKYCVRCGKEV